MDEQVAHRPAVVGTGSRPVVGTDPIEQAEKGGLSVKEVVADGGFAIECHSGSLGPARATVNANLLLTRRRQRAGPNPVLPSGTSLFRSRCTPPALRPD